MLTLTNIFYLPNNLSTLVSLGLLNDIGIYHYHKNQRLYNQSTPKTFAFVEKYKTSFLLHPLNLSSAVIYLLRDHKVYKKLEVNQTQSERLHLIL